MIKGIDVSYHQGKIDFKKVKDSGIEFVILRCGYGKNKFQKDKKFEQYYKECKSVGLKVGAYLYSYAKSMEDVRKEIETCLFFLENKNFDLPIFYDLEEKEQYSKFNITTATQEWINSFNKKGYKAGVYINLDWYKNHFNYNELSNCYLWLAQWNNNNKPDIKVNIWQYTNKGTVPGISTDVDLNIFYDENESNVNTTEKSLEEIAQEVIKGYWNNGNQRKLLLEKAGYNYSEIQFLVNQLLINIPATYNIKKGDTLSKIAKKYNLSIKQICNLNNIKNPNFIKAGDILKLK